MAEETWFSAAEAIALGLADDVDADAPAMAAHFDPATYGYRNAPASLVASASTTPPVPAAVTQPATPGRKEHNMSELKLFAEASGLKAEASAAEVVAKIQAQREDAAKVPALQARVTAFEEAVGDDSAGAPGVAKAHAESHGKLPEVEAKLAKIAADADADKRTALIAQGKKDGKLTEPLIKLYAEKPLAEFEAFLKVAPKVVPVNEGVTQPRAAGAGADDGEAAPTHEGKTYEALTGPEKVALKASNPELFAQMRAHFNASH